MRRSGILYDYKPRLEWIDPAAARKRRRRRKLLTGAGVLILAGILGNFFLSSQPRIESVESSLSLEKPVAKTVSKPLPLPPLAKEETMKSKVVAQSPDNTSIAAKPVEGKKTVPEVQSPSETVNSKIVQKKRQDDDVPSNAQLKNVFIPPPKEKWRTVTVKEGDNLSLIFSRLAISKNDLYEILSLGEDTQSLKRLKPGQVLKLKFENSKIEELVHEADLTHTLKVKKKDDEFEARMIEEKPEIRIANASGRINDSLFLSGQRAGLSDNILMQLFDIFGWDIDFVLDIREGDEFRVIYEELFKNGEKVKDGRILAAEFINQGKGFKAVYFNEGDESGYYSEDGKSMKKAFLRTPVNFTRISSRFNLKRKHPVLNKIRAHKGVDYAAPMGTPVKATGNGKVVFVGTKNGYGNTVIIQHGGKYSTLYAHLSRFARGLKKGKRVEQGQTIAYVGKTGLATGPHLHYEFRINGVHRDPLTVELPKSLPLPKKYMPDFLRQSKPLLTQLASIGNPKKETRRAETGKKKKTPTKIDMAAREYPSQQTIN